MKRIHKLDCSKADEVLIAVFIMAMFFLMAVANFAPVLAFTQRYLPR
jgi:hypothetical protein